MRKSIIAVMVAGLMASSTAFATNGYFAHGYSTTEKGMGGAGVAYGQDAMASATNPAGLVNVGERLDVGLALFAPKRKYTVTGPMSPPPAFSLNNGTYESDNELFAIPHFGMTFAIDDKSVIGVAAYGNGGMNSEYVGVPSPMPGMPDGTFYGGTTGVDFKQLFINVSYARKLDKNNSVGVSIIGAAQTFKATGLAAFGGTVFPGSPNMSVDNTNLTNNGTDTAYGAGAKIGWVGNVADSLILGASYQSKIYMSEFDDYSGLFAEGGDFDVPATATIGLAWNATDTSVVALDVQQIYYSDVKSLGNGIDNLFNPNIDGRLGSDDGAGFGWDDMTIVKVGYEFGSNTRWRVGASYGEQPIDETMFSILAPAVITTHYTAGFTTPIGNNQSISFAGMYAPSNTVTAANPMDPGQNIAIEMHQYEIQGTYSLMF